MTRTRFTEDETNTRQFVGLHDPAAAAATLRRRPASVHWHVLQDVDYWSPDEHAQKIDWSRSRETDGTTERVHRAGQDRRVQPTSTPDITAIKATEPSPHDGLPRLPQPGRPPDPATRARRSTTTSRPGASIPTLPYIKLQAMNILTADYPNVDGRGRRRSTALQDFYELQLPGRRRAQGAAIDAGRWPSVKRLYRAGRDAGDEGDRARPTRTTSGHIDFPGCFRCHDGGHFKVVDGKVDHRGHPVDVRHLPHVPADRAGGRGPAARRSRRPPTTTRCGSSTTRTSRRSVDPGGQTLRRVPRPGLLCQLPLHGCGDRQPRRRW